jgi:murein endopeptidase
VAATLAVGLLLGGGAALGRHSLGAETQLDPVDESSRIRHESRDSPSVVSATDERPKVGTQSARIRAKAAVRKGSVVRSRALGLPWRGELVAGVQLPAAGPTFFTWDPIHERAPNRAWRRWGTDRLVRTLTTVLREFAAAHPEAPRIGVGDLSRPQGGDFGPRYGPPGHLSHQNGLDADVYYPRRDRRERAAESPDEIDRVLAQDLVDRFVAAGAVKVFVGPRTGLRGDPRIVQPLRLHDDHLHVRLP